MVDAIYDAGDMMILPGLIDIHVHFREPGMEYKEDFESGSKCAIASGVTVVGDMPNNIPRIDSLERFSEKAKLIHGKSYVDYFLYMELAESEEIKKSLKLKNPPRAIKVYLPDRRHHLLISGDRFPRDMLYVFHAEHPDYLDEREVVDLEDLYKARPPEAELKGIEFAIRFAQQGYRVHITHVSIGRGIERIMEAKRAGLKVTCDTTPHYLVFYLERVPRDSPIYKVLPPLRRKEERDKLLRALAMGYIDIIASDHAPHHVDEKKDFKSAGFGIQSLQYLLPIMFSLCKKMHISFEKVLEKMTSMPARVFGLKWRGRIRPGYFADLVVFDGRKKWVVDPEFCYSKSKISPYDGMLLRGEVRATFLRGHLVFEDGEFLKRIGKHV